MLNATHIQQLVSNHFNNPGSPEHAVAQDFFRLQLLYDYVEPEAVNELTLYFENVWGLDHDFHHLTLTFMSPALVAERKAEREAEKAKWAAKRAETKAKTLAKRILKLLRAE